MKLKYRVLTLLLSAAMMLTLMPSLAFAEDKAAASGNEANSTESDLSVLKIEASLDYSGASSMEVEYGNHPAFSLNDTITVTKGSDVYSYLYEFNSSGFGYKWNYSGQGTDPLELDKVIINYPEPFDNYKAGSSFNYSVSVLFKDETVIESAEYTGGVLPMSEATVGYLKYHIRDDGTAEILDNEYSGNEPASVTIPAVVDMPDGTSHPVIQLSYAALYGMKNCTSVSVPSSITSIEEYALGIYYDPDTNTNVKVPGFTIFGKTGSEAQRYADDNGFIFRDPEAEEATAAVAAAEKLDWDGTPGAIPPAKSVKVKAAKKKVVVSWKKANKKNLKKFDKIEIQVCSDKAFARANTKRVEVKKSRKSRTVSNLSKKKTYYVRVRHVKGSGSGKIVSRWSKVRKIKTR